MAVPILFELNQELIRLFAAGSRLSADDPRLKKFIPPLQKYGEKAPVFLKLAGLVEELLTAGANDSARKLMETESLLLSVLSTQGENPALPACPSVGERRAGEASGLAGNTDRLGPTGAGFQSLSPVVKALTMTGGGRLEIIRNAYEKGIFADPRLFPATVDALGDRFGEIADFIAQTVLPSLGWTVYPFLLQGYDPRGGPADGRRLAVMYRIAGEEVLPLVDEAASQGSADVKVEAIRIMAGYPRYEGILLSMLEESKAVREEAMKALVKIDSRTGIDRLLEIFKGGKTDTVMEAIVNGNNDYLTGELLKQAYVDYEAIKSGSVSAADVARLHSDLNALQDKTAGGAVRFWQTILSEDCLDKAEAGLPRDQRPGHFSHSLGETALTGLYRTGQGDDFIWHMFMSSQGGLFKKKKPAASVLLHCYAFRIGARKLEPKEFYTVFFKSGIYKDVISRAERDIFRKVFLQDLQDGQPPAYSDKIAGYFAAQMDDYHKTLATEIVSSRDTETLNLLAEHLRQRLAGKSYHYDNIDILKKLGESRHKSFPELYRQYCDYGRINDAEKEYLEQIMNEYR